MSVLSLLDARKTLGASLLMGLVACSGTAQATNYTMLRDVGCGCCEDWAVHARTGLKAEITIQNSADMAAVKEHAGVPRDLRSCHTMMVDGYVIEGHVPAADIARLLRERPAGVAGLAVAGMPLGSPGMETTGRAQPYQVIAFGKSGRAVFSRYN